MQQVMARNTYERPLGKKPFLVTALFIIAYLVIDFASYHNIVAFTYLVLFFGLLLPVINIRLGFYYYLIISLLSDDVSRIYTSNRYAPFTSVHITSLGPLTIMAAWTLFMSFILISHHVMVRKKIKLCRFDKYMLSLVMLYVFAGIVGIPNFFQFTRTYIHDASYIINMVVCYFLVRLAFRKENELKKLISLVMVCYGARTIVSLLFYLLGIGRHIGHNIKVGYDSGYTILALLVFFCLCVLIHVSRMKLEHRLLLWILGFAGLFNIITFSSRGDVITFVLGFFIILFALRGNSVRKGTRAKFIFTLALIAVLSFTTINTVRPGALNYLKWKMSTVIPWDLTGVGPNAALSALTRVLEAMNIFQKELSEGSLVWGEGLGGWFTDYYPFPNYDPSAFSEEELLMRKFFSPHGTQLVIFLKMGIGGFLFYYFIMLLLFRESYLVYQKMNNKYFKSVALAFLSFLPVLFYKNYTSKLQVFFGLALAILANIQALQSKREIRVQIIYPDTGSKHAGVLASSVNFLR